MSTMRFTPPRFSSPRLAIPQRNPHPMLSAASSTTTVHHNRDGSSLNPVTPMNSSRYEPLPRLIIQTIHTVYEQGTHVKGERDAKTRRLGVLPDPWEQWIHPDGKLYFRNKVWNAVTEVDVRNPDSLRNLESWYDDVQTVRKTIDAELYLALDPEPGYYCVDHGEQQVFWVENYALEKIVPEGESSTELFILQNYYRHLEHFPCHNVLPPDGMEFLRSALTYACTDHMTSGESATAPWNADECKTFLDLLSGIPKSDTQNPAGTSGVHDGYNVWFVARLLCIILLSQRLPVHSRLVHRYGMYDACTDRLPATNPSLPSMIDILAGAASFCAHFSYLERLETVWAQEIVSTTGWRSLMTSLLTEWADSNLLATVMLSANMAFLALNDIGLVERASSVVSTFFSIGSIAVGLHHVWRHRVKKDSNAAQASIYFENGTRTTRSPKLLSFFLSLPVVLLSWSLLTFGCSVALYAFHQPRPGSSYFVTGPAFALVVLIATFTIIFFWDIFVKHRQLR